MDRIKLTSHVKKGDTLYTPYTEPDGLGKSLRINSWSICWLPEFLWIGLTINDLGRKDGLEQLYKIINDLQENKICVSHFSKIIQLDMEKRKLFWKIVSSHVPSEVLSPFTVVITPDIDEVFYNCLRVKVVLTRGWTGCTSTRILCWQRIQTARRASSLSTVLSLERQA